MIWLEIVGFLASVLVAISLAMKNILKLRIINTTGAIIFVIYGLIIQAYPVFLVNLIIILVNLYYLNDILTSQDKFEILKIKNGLSVLLEKFIDYYQTDIQDFFPQFNREELDEEAIEILILRNMIPVGIFITEPINENELEILVDYIIPEYRDFKNGEYLFREGLNRLKEQKYHTLYTSSDHEEHKTYLKKVGFQIIDKEDGRYKKKL
ncbi:MAG: hypothetical protein R6U96_01955 [Promethearchaeia archaeon]